jgi:hypothetical protein
MPQLQYTTPSNTTQAQSATITLPSGAQVSQVTVNTGNVTSWSKVGNTLTVNVNNGTGTTGTQTLYTTGTYTRTATGIAVR